LYGTLINSSVILGSSYPCDQIAAFRQQFTIPIRQIPQNPCEINPAIFTTPKKDVTGNDDDASLDRGTTANGTASHLTHLLGETKEDGGKIKSKLPRTDPFNVSVTPICAMIFPSSPR